MNVFKGLKLFLTNKEKRTIFLAQHGFYKHMSDKDFLCMQFENVFGYKMNLEHPKAYSEKIQWLKLYDRKPEYTMMVDKYLVKEYVANIIGKEHIIETLGVWDSFDEINFNTLPDKFVLKCTHDSGGVIICTDKSKFDIKSAKRKINKCLKNDYYMQNREWPYKNVQRRIIAEKYMVDNSGYELKDYKVFTFNGQAKAMFIATDRSNELEETKFDFYDMDFNHLPFLNGHPNSKSKIEKPLSLELMKMYAEMLSKDLPHARIDFYEIDGVVYFGEITFYHWSGFKKFEPFEWDLKFGEWIELPKEKFYEDGILY